MRDGTTSTSRDPAAHAPDSTGASALKPIHAAFENGVFPPIEPVELPERCEVVFEPRMIIDRSPEAHRARVHALLGRPIETGEIDMVERHDEPLP